jgi:membrane-associated protease RseP (regulator of RpoE activity)
MYKQNICRGVAYWQAESAEARAQPCGKRILYAAQNAVLHAVDADTGRACAGFGAGGRVDLAALDYKGEGKPATTSPPAIWGDVVALGVAVQDMTQPLADSFGLARPDGALVSQVMPGSPAAAAGLRAGDVIQKIDGQPTVQAGALSARIAQSIATAIKTLIVGMGFLSTFSSAFVALGLFLVFIRSLSRAETPGAS